MHDASSSRDCCERRSSSAILTIWVVWREPVRTASPGPYSPERVGGKFSETLLQDCARLFRDILSRGEERLQQT
jgi:hypothetical protein